MLPPAVAGIALLAAVGPSTLLGRTAQDAGLQLALATAGVVVALTFVAAPFYLRQAIAAFEAIDPTLLDASRTLGASPARTFCARRDPDRAARARGGHGAGARPRARGVRGDADVRRLVPGDHADRPARDLRPLRHRLHGGARALGRAGGGLGGDPARRSSSCAARTRWRDDSRAVRGDPHAARRRPRARPRARGRRPASASRWQARRARARRACCARWPACWHPPAAASPAARSSGSTRRAASASRPSGGAAATCSRSTRCSGT